MLSTKKRIPQSVFKKIKKSVLLSLGVMVISTHFIFAQFANFALSTFEVGKIQNVTCNFTKPHSNSKAVVVSYTWTVSWLGLQGGQIAGSLNGQKLTSVTVNSSSTSNTASIVYGDFFNSITSDIISCNVVWKDSADATFTKTYFAINAATIKRICPPTFDKNSIQKCCVSPFQLTANACDGNQFTWSVSGASFTGQGQKTITITPGSTGDISVSCTARRNESLTA